MKRAILYLKNKEDGSSFIVCISMWDRQIVVS